VGLTNKETLKGIYGAKVKVYKNTWSFILRGLLGCIRRTDGLERAGAMGFMAALAELGAAVGSAVGSSAVGSGFDNLNIPDII
jgi:hypothetical protein